MRVPPLNKERMHKCIHAILEARREAMQHETPGLMSGDLYAFFDGAKPKLKAKFKMMWGPQPQIHGREFTLHSGAFQGISGAFLKF